MKIPETKCVCGVAWIDEFIEACRDEFSMRGVRLIRCPACRGVMRAMVRGRETVVYSDRAMKALAFHDAYFSIRCRAAREVYLDLQRPEHDLRTEAQKISMFEDRTEMMRFGTEEGYGPEEYHRQKRKHNSEAKRRCRN